MATKLRLLFTITIVFISFCASAQRDYWARETAGTAITKQIAQRFDVRKGSVFTFGEAGFNQALESVSVSGKSSKIVRFPDSDGQMAAYRVVETPVFSPALSQKYPNIKSYTGYGVENPGKKVCFSTSPKGLQAMFVHSDGSDTGFIQKVSEDTYVRYSRDQEQLVDTDFVCRTQDRIISQGGNLTARPVDGQVLRKYRLAITATGEYTDFHGGSVADALAAINATVTRINAVFETDLAVRLELVANTDAAIYTDAATDPFSGKLSGLGNEGQDALTNAIGEANYDIGHVFHNGPDGGNAGFIGAVCVDNRKGSAYASSRTPEGDLFDLDFAAHEMGHQLGANHTWSYQSEDTQAQVEPGSGTTIMGYAGVTDNNNVAPNGDDYFHFTSIEQIITNLETKSCGEVVAIDNTPPVVDALDDYIIPKSTAFVLTGNATDADAADILTYTWEQIDNGIVSRATFGPTNPSGANFRSRPPVTEPVRYFPFLSRVVAGNLTQTDPAVDSAWETVSEVERELNFAFTVRDNAPNGGQVVSELTTIAVTNSAGPFSVLSQETPATYTAGEIFEIVWDVAGTNQAPVNTQTVDIFLSTDGGISFPVALAEGVLNDGSHEITVPGIPTTEARIMVKAVDNVFFAVNASDFSIEESKVVLNFSDLEYKVCQAQDLTIPFLYETAPGFDEEVTFSVTGAPAGLGLSFSPKTAVSGDTPVNLLIAETENLPEGNYELFVTATSASVTEQIPLQLAISNADFPEVTLTAPTDGLADASSRIPMVWEGDPSYVSYEIQIATDAAFADIVETDTVFSNTYTPNGLGNETNYFWRVKPTNSCGEGTFSPAFNFTTVALTCKDKTASGLPLKISGVGTPSVVSKIAFVEDRTLADINVNLDIDHNNLQDLTISLTSPAKTTVVLVSNSCGKLKNMNATFDDAAPDFVCDGDADAAITGTVKPLVNLSAFNGESIAGEWILEVKDNASLDGGALNGFSLDICVEGEFRPDADEDGVFDDGDDLCLDTAPGAEVDASGCPIYRFPADNFTVSVQGESCRDKDDGQIMIEAAGVLDLTYDISVTGNGTAISESFGNAFTTPGLEAGTYTVCINGSSGEIDYQEYCFEVSVIQPEPLGVTATLSEDGTQVSLEMAGAESYTVVLNGRSLRTEKSQVTLDLNAGTNQLKVSTDQACQGVYEDRFILSEDPAVFPNPFAHATRLFMGAVEEKLTIAIFSMDGQLIKKEVYTPNRNQLDLDFTGLPPGVYMLKFEGQNSRGSTKVIKQQ
ncbi:MAG TPA: zinc-dependent metalloprotease family protein [Pricia sp.]|nr:zinc-dependent metalloprotease family protein [Pricia sp.]